MNQQVKSVINDDELEKSAKDLAAAIGMSAAIALGGGSHESSSSAAVPHHDTIAQHSQAPTPAIKSVPRANAYDSDKMLRTIASVESSGGTNTNHKPVGGMHHGESAYGKYALMPNTIRETIKLNHDLSSKYKKIAALKGDDLHRFLDDNPGLEDVLAKKHLSRLEHHFGGDPIKIGYSWNQGIRGTNRAIKEGINIGDHPYSKKIKAYYSQKD